MPTIQFRTDDKTKAASTALVDRPGISMSESNHQTSGLETKGRWFPENAADETEKGELSFDGLLFVMTCEACPEQYDVFDMSGKQVGYVRLRHGELRCDHPVCGGETIYKVYTIGDGCFDTDEERDFHLGEIARKLEEIHLS
ncbi:MAG: type II toxin-antitoxin system RelB/DinJ family antitoxin [Treponema sp.]|jgi:hypothetical protein|nr:type II toxin-antitoxin system RelB/DinJ family antitoxin [Treponema sp.]